ncbi:MAG: histidine kinase [Acidobacteriota bacterium]|nr:histidine kinase [Acidobacteriota bacterium]
MEEILTKAHLSRAEAIGKPSFGGLFDRVYSFWQLQIYGWLIYLVMMYVTFLTVAAPGTYWRLFQIKLVRTVIGFFLTCGMRLIYRRFTNLSIQGTVLLVLMTSIVFGLAWAFIEMTYASLTAPNFVWASALARSPRTSLDYGLTLTAWSALYFGIKYWLAWQRERENALQAAALANQAQLEVLRYQLNPHFLFNSLNSIRASIDEDSRRAKQMVTQLAEFLRYSLTNDGSEMIPLRDEIEAARNYLAIEKIRFEEKLEVNFNIEKAAEDLPVPPFLLNPLIENAVKHGLNGGSKPLKILVTARLGENDLILEVANTGTLSRANSGTKVGLKNVNQRLEKIFGELGELTLNENNGWVQAQIRIKNDETKSFNR